MAVKAAKANAIDGPDVIGLLARSVPTRLLDISRTGCLLESHQHLEDGMVGELRLHVDRQVFLDDVRVTRCVLVKGSGSVYRIGAEFLQTRRPGDRSIRLAVGTLLRELMTRRPQVRAAGRKPSKTRDGNGTPSPAIVNPVPSTGEKAS